MTVGDVYCLIDAFAPFSRTMTGDNAGLLVGSPEQEVRSVLLALDGTRAVCREAAERGDGLILLHHPIIYNPLRRVAADSAVGILLREGISAISAHTNLDGAPGGVTERLCELAGVGDVTPIADPEEPNCAVLRQGTVIGQPLEAFCARVKESLPAQGVRFISGGKQVGRVAVGAGGCGGMWRLALEAGCDTFLTADVRYDVMLDASEAGMNVVDAGHYATENIVLPVFERLLKDAYPTLPVFYAQSHSDLIRFC